MTRGLWNENVARAQGANFDIILVIGFRVKCVWVSGADSNTGVVSGKLSWRNKACI